MYWDINAEYYKFASATIFLLLFQCCSCWNDFFSKNIWIHIEFEQLNFDNIFKQINVLDHSGHSVFGGSEDSLGDF